MSYEPLHHKYRPQTFADLVGQEAIATTLTNAIRTSKIAPAYLFNGPRGTGKTSSARILAKSLNCLKSDKPTEQPCGVCEVCKAIANGSALDVIEIDAASNTGVENIRDLIERAQFAPVQCRYKVYCIDECHMLSSAAFNALLKTLEEPPARVVFVLATTDPQRVLPTIISRCQRFDFRRIPLEAMVTHLRKIATIENINITQEAVQLVAQVSQGGLRDAESLLDQLSLLSGEVTVERVWDLVGSCSEPDLMALLAGVAQNNPEAVLDRARIIMDRGREPLTVLQNLAEFYRDLLIAKTAPNRSDLVAVTPSTWTQLCEQAKSWDIAIILRGQQRLKDSEVQIKNSSQPRLWLEVTLLGLLPLGNTAAPVSHVVAANDVNEAQSKPPTPQPVAPIAPPPPVHRDHPQQSSDSLHRSEALQVSNPKPPEEDVEPLPSASQPDGQDSSLEIPQEQIWQQVLAHLQPPSTQALLRQMGHLIEFDGTVARIGMKSQAWCNQAKAYLPNITAAFQETFKREVQVRLELAKANQTKTAAVKEPGGRKSETPSGLAPRSPLPQASSSTITAPASPPQVADPDQVSSNLTGNSSSQTQALTQFQAGMAAGESTPSMVSESPTMGVATSTSTPAASWDKDEVAIASQRLAEFFNGEVVRINLDSAFPEWATTNSLPSTSADDWYDADQGEEEAESDF